MAEGINIPICEECNVEMDRYEDSPDTNKGGYACPGCGWSDDDASVLPVKVAGTRRQRTPLTQRKLKQLVRLLGQYRDDQYEKEEPLVVVRAQELIRWIKEDIEDQV